MTRPRFSYEGGGRVAAAMAGVVLACSGTGCGSRGGANASDPADAAVTTFQSAAVTNPATWNSLWGSWPSARYDHAMAYDADQKRIVMFGGRGATSGPHYGDLWEWDSMKGNWNQRTPPGLATNLPYDRSGHSMVYDTIRKKTIMFGGWQPSAGFIHPEWWEWDGTAQTWTKHPLTTGQPTPRFNASMVWDSGRNRVVLFGGIDETTGRLQDTWEWDGASWIDRTPSGTKPSARHGSRMAYDPVQGKTLLYTGNTDSDVGTATATGGTWVDETWEYDGSAATGPGTWTRIAVTGPSSTMWVYPTHLAFDPSTSKMILHWYWNQMWEYNAATPGWAAVPTTTPTKVDTAEPPYNDTPIVYDANRQKLVFFGGQSGQRRQLWELNTGDYSWANRSTPVNGPIQRTYPSIAFNSKTGTMLVFGGYSSLDASYKQDIWEWSGSGSTLTNRTTGGTKPAPRNQAGLVYDSKRDRLLLFGGYSSSVGAYDDLWTWDNATSEWSQITFTGTRPTGRYGVWMFYDAARDKVYVYGVYWAGYQIWEYDPALNKWLDRTVTSPPTGVSRNYFDVGFDSVRGKIVEVGGSGPGGYNTEMWEWDTTTGTWAAAMPAPTSLVPDGRYYHTVAYDPLRRVMLLVGGHVQITGRNEPVNDSWEWDANLATWTETTPPGVKPLPREQHMMVFNSTRGSTYLFGGTVSADTTYGPSEFWEYLPSVAERENGAGCTAGTADKCKSKNCVDGVCCAQSATECNGTCKSCNVAGKAGTCNNVPAGLPDETCPGDLACDANQQCKALLGHSCSSFMECASGQCTDGVCCNTACTGTCQQCNQIGKLGTCSPVANGIEDPPTCVSDTDSRFCDGTGTCTVGKRANGKPCTASAQCTSNNCIDGFCCNSTCTSTCYTCGKPGSEGTCSVIPIGQPDRSATTPCDGPMQYCDGSGTCATNKKPNGGLCAGASECGSNFCVDGICCNNACLGTCQACNVTGSEGTCVNSSTGAQDVNATVPCTGPGMFCEAGVCQSGKKANGAVCAAANECGSNFCVDGVCCEGQCNAPCYTCSTSGNGKCTGIIAGGSDNFPLNACMAPNFCTSLRECTTGKKSNGATCAADSECGSNFCVDGVCCESACSGPSNKCKTCKNATGTCTFAAAGTDARMDCKGEVAACGGTCDGQGACAYAPQGKSCRTAGCQPDLGQISNAGVVCDGAGNCPIPPNNITDCNGFGCYTDTNGGAQCKTDCSTDPDCAIRRYCEVVADGGTADGGKTTTCPAQFPLGHACVRGPQCLSMNCAIPLGGTVGVCCNTDCSHCGTCDSTGTCIPDPAGTPSPSCADSASDPMRKCGGMCDGHAHCQYPSAGTSCGTASSPCKACNGVGLCNLMPEDDPACGTIDCDVLNTTCREHEDLTTKRCASIGACKAPNTAASCTVFTDTCTGTGGSAGGRGGAGGGAGGRGGSGGSGGGSAGTTGGGGSSGGGAPRGGTTGTAGSTTGSAGATGTDGGGTAGTAGGGGGGCCSVGGADTPTGVVGLLVFASVLLTRRRRR